MRFKSVACFVGIALSGWAVPASASAPAECVASGQRTLTFESDFTNDRAAFDQSMTYKPGFKWYRWNWFGVKPNPALATRKSDGVLSVHEVNGGFRGHVTSAAHSTNSPGFVGTAFGGGVCVQVVLRFNPDNSRSENGHPSFWSMSMEHLDGSGNDQWPGKEAGFAHFVEWDIFEYFKAKPPAFLSSWIDWFGKYSSGISNKPEVGACPRPYCKKAGSFAPHIGTPPNDLKWGSWQTLTGIWVPASGARPGHIQTFLNGRAYAEPKTWMARGAPRGGGDQLFDFSRIDEQHQVLVISSGDTPMEVQSVRVWQKDSSKNLSK
ncbi:hypothetical protein WSK_1611 [Novosphingobium sp. Rr 2-17]|uniref:hypothetical protein n=1 Tax=Novosphingobium sp. Rr 2-17 TaxID=555793 RepID=UPI0002699B8D|nr:hypothetical protein [Novosphingobium sp. Rr 2-17]EIZ79786.1 hypothetical protein WSK_1611 [Novosphingobium sp. Rr 2-17]